MASLIVLLVLWSVLVRASGVKEFLLPGPERVFATMWAERDTLIDETIVSAWETLLGFGLSVLLGIPTALLLTESRLAFLIGNPLIVRLQTVPKIAVAPLLVVWLGFGPSPKVIVVVLVAFFPIVVNARRLARGSAARERPHHCRAYVASHPLRATDSLQLAAASASITVMARPPRAKASMSSTEELTRIDRAAFLSRVEPGRGRFAGRTVCFNPDDQRSVRAPCDERQCEIGR